MNRGLLGRSENEDALAGTAALSSDEVAGGTEDTLGLRIAAVFIILAAGLLGGVPPLFIKTLQNQDSLHTFLVRAFSAGVILALALVHIVPEAIEELVDIGGVAYPIGGTSVLFGLLIMVFIEHGAHLMYGMPHGHAHAHQQDDGHHRIAAAPAPAPEAGQASSDADAKRPDAGGRQRSHTHGGSRDHSRHGQGKLHCRHIPSPLAAAAAPAPVPPQLKQDQQQVGQRPPLRVQPAKGAPPGGAAPSEGAFVRHSAGPSLCHRVGATGAAAGAAGGGGDGPLAKANAPLCCSSSPLLGRGVRSEHGACGAVAAEGEEGAVVVASAEAAAVGGPVSRALLLQWPPDHCHDCVSRSSAPNWASAVEATTEGGSPLRLRIIAYLFELGCIFHSFIIGLSLGVNQTSLSQVRALLLALAFHQALEGLSLASVINRGGFSTLKAATMVAMYSVTCPAGVAIGIAVASSYDPESTQARGAQGCLNGVSGGMLLYISLVQLVAEDMGKYLGEPAEEAGGSETDAAAATRGSRPACGHGHAPGSGGMGYRIRMPSFLAFCAGAASMCTLAVWA